MRLLHEIAIFQKVKSKVIISLFQTVRLSVSISLRNLYTSLNSIKETLFAIPSAAFRHLTALRNQTVMATIVRVPILKFFRVHSMVSFFVL